MAAVTPCPVTEHCFGYLLRCVRPAGHEGEHWASDLEEEAPTCQHCGDAIHDGNTCIECWRDRREIAMARDREWRS